ncbi:MAG: hypothetical protein Q7K57_11860 [Burkholderiaceae bacterium]|nr:hypothetical protein [Burkholderiaceae bacterium]
MRELFIRTIGVLVMGIIFLVPGLVMIYVVSPPILLVMNVPISNWSMEKLVVVWQLVISHPVSFRFCLLFFGGGIAWGLFQQVSMYFRDRRNRG